MRRSVASSFRRFVFAFAAVCVIGLGTPLLAQTCPDLPFDYSWPIAPDPAKIVSMCPEACIYEPRPRSAATVPYDDDVDGLIDVVYAQCGAYAGLSAQVVPIRSDFLNCWRCEGDAGCGLNCPPGELCVQQPGLEGSDCRRFGCNDPRYQPVENGYDTNGKIIVVCRLKPTETCTTTPPPSCVPATVTLSGPTKIQPGATCEWSATASSSSGCTAGDYIYHWYAANQWVGGGQSYTGGKPSGVLNGYPWKLRVEVVTPDGTFAGKHEITVSESSNAPVCFY